MFISFQRPPDKRCPCCARRYTSRWYAPWCPSCGWLESFGATRSAIEVGDVLVLREAWSCRVNTHELGVLDIGDIVCIITVKIDKHGMHSITALSTRYGRTVVLNVSNDNVAMLFGVH